MLLLLYLFLSSFLLAAAAYIVLVRTNVCTTVLASLLRALLRRVQVIQPGGSCALGPCPGGIVLTDIQLPSHLFAIESGPVTVSTVSIKRLQLLWATASLPLTLRAAGVSVKVQQRRTAPQAQPGATPRAHSNGKLQELEALIWRGQKQSSSGGWRARTQQQLLRLLVALLLRNVSVAVEDVSFSYVQTGDPGPVLTDAETGAADAIAVALRTIVLSPVTSTQRTGPGAACAPTSVGRDEQQEGPSAGAASGGPANAGRWQDVQKRLQDWWHANTLPPRLRALRRRLRGAFGGGPSVRFCNASRVCVTGVSIKLLSKGPAASGPMFQGLAQRTLQPLPYFRSDVDHRKRVRRAGGAHPASDYTSHAAHGEPVVAAPTGHEWDSTYTVLQQWSMEVEVSLDLDVSDKQGGGRSSGRSRAGRQTPAVKVQGAFGIRSNGAHHTTSSRPAPDRDDGRGRSHIPSPECESPSGPSPRHSLRSSIHLPPQWEQFLRGPQRQSAGLTARDSGGAAGPDNGATGGSNSCSAAAPFTVQISITLKALVAELTPDATVQLLRMVDRLSTYQKYSKYWRLRPSASVRQNPAAWWQHAGRAIIADCRQHYPLRKLRDFMARRAEYIRCYKELRSAQPGFLHSRLLPRYSLDPADYRLAQSTAEATNGNASVHANLLRRLASSHAGDASARSQSGSRIWPLDLQRHRPAAPGTKALADAQAQLARLESELTLGQIMCYRIFVALGHSRYLADTPHAKERWEDMGVITTFVDAVPTMEEGEEEDDDTDAAEPETQPAGSSGSGPRKRAAPSVISLRVSCPRMGLKLINKLPAPAAAEAATANARAAGVPGPTAQKGSADVLAVMLEGIRFVMPDAHHLTLEAAVVRVSLLGNASAPPKHLLIMPALPDSMVLHGTKMDFSTPAAGRGSHAVSAKQSSPMGSIYPDAPISSYLSRYAVSLAPVELAFTHPPLVLACAQFLKRMTQLRATAQRAGAAGSSAGGWPSTSLHSLVMDSCRRNRIPLPSSMATFIPKLHVQCPMVTARGLLLPEHTPSIGGLSPSDSEVLVVAVLTDIRLSSRYVNTCYATLVQSASAQAHAEVYFQAMPRNVASPSASGPSGLPKPQLGPFGKMWLHPDDVDIAYPPPQAAGVESVGKPLNGRERLYRMMSTLKASDIPQLSEENRSPTPQPSSGNAGSRHPPPNTSPFVPVLKLRSVSVLAKSQVPYEPAVPGTMTSHHTVGVHSVLAWFSPWQAKLIMAVVEQLRAHPVLAVIRSDHDERKASAAATAAHASSTRQPSEDAYASACAAGVSADPEPRDVQTQQCAPTAAVQPTGGSRVSLLLDIPLIVVNTYVEVTAPSYQPEDLLRRYEAMCQSGAEIQLPPWVTSSYEWFSGAAKDPVLRWGVRLTPMLTINITNVRAGLRLTGSNKVHASLHTTGIQAVDHQARFKHRVYKEIWLANAGRAARTTSATTAEPSPETARHQLMGPPEVRASALRAFARDRRRAALRLAAHHAPTEAEKHGQSRQQWRRLLEARQVHLASDFAMFLLSSTHRTAARLSSKASLQPFRDYTVLLSGSRAPEQQLPTPTTQSTEVPPEAVAGVSSRDGPAGSLPAFQSSPSVGSSGPAVGGDGAPMMRRHTSVHARSIGGMGDISALERSSGAGRPSVGASQHRKTMSMFQVLNSVSAAAAALHRKSFAAAAAARSSSSEANRSYNASPSWLGNAGRSSMRRIPEDAGLEPTSSDRRSLSAGQPSVSSAAGAGSTAALAAGASWRGRASMLWRRSSMLDRTGKADGETLPGRRDALCDPGLNGLHSVFTTASAESRAAAAGAAMPNGTGLTGTVSGAASIPLQPSPPSSSMAVAESKLSFVLAYAHLGKVSLPSAGTPYVHSLPRPTPSFSAVLSRLPGDRDAPAATHVRASGEVLLMCVGAHSLGAMLHMLVQVQQALCVTPSAPIAPEPKRPSRPGLFKGEVDARYIAIKMVMEEKPRRANWPVDKPLPVGLTELTTVKLQRVSACMGPEQDASSSNAGDCTLTVRISDLSVLDLQGCAEHRNVLVGNDRVGAAVRGAARPQRPDGSHAATHRGNGADAAAVPKSCSVDLTCSLPSSPGAALQLTVRVNDPCITLLRRYVNNLSYASGVVYQAYLGASRRNAHASEAGTVGAATQSPSAAGGPLNATAVPQRPSVPPEILIQVNNISAVLPAGVLARKLSTRRSVQNDALVLDVASVTASIPGGSIAQRLKQLVAWAYELSAPPCGGGDAEDAVDLTWMASEPAIESLIASSVQLGEQHFPPLGQQAPPPAQQAVGRGQHGPGDQPAARARDAPQVSVSRTPPSPPGGLLQKHLQAAKENFFNPLKEILREAGQKRIKQHGEQGLLVIDEGPSRSPAAEARPGYLTIPEEHHERTLASAAAVHHTTTAIYANLVTEPQPLNAAGRERGDRLTPSASTSPSAGLQHGTGPAGSPESPVMSHAHRPTALFSVYGLSAYSCKLVPYDSAEYSLRQPAAAQGPPGGLEHARRVQRPNLSQRRLPPDAPMSSSYQAATRPSTPHGYQGQVRRNKSLRVFREDVASGERDPDYHHPDLESALRVLAETELQQVQCLIDPCRMDGVIFAQGPGGAIQLHVAAAEGMEATLGPTSYERMLKVLTDNIVEARSCFDVAAAGASDNLHRNTSFNAKASFGLRPGERPFFHLTVAWPEMLQAVLETDPAWWAPEKLKEPCPAEPCLQACFSNCSLGLVLMRGTNDLHIAFHSQEAHVADVRLDNRLAKASAEAASSNGRINSDLGVGQVPSLDPGFSGSSNSFIEEEYVDDEDEAEAHGTEAGASGQQQHPLDTESTELPEVTNVQAVIDHEPPSFPGRSAVVTLLRSGIHLPADEATHLARNPGDCAQAGECPLDDTHKCVRVAFGMLQDGTMCNEIELCHSLVQWPYLTEMSLVSSIISVFLPTWGKPAQPEALLRMAATPWLYFNLVLRDSQLYVPLLTPHLRQYEYGWRAAAAGASDDNLEVTADKLQQLFARMAAPEPAPDCGLSTEGTDTGGRRYSDYGLWQHPAAHLPQSSLRRGAYPLHAGTDNVSSFAPSSRWGGLSLPRLAGGAADPEQKLLEDTGIAVTVSALRIGHFAGGDGESVLKIDMRNAAGFVRHQGSQVTNWLLPIRSMSMEYHCCMQLVSESWVLRNFLRVARLIKLQLRTRKKKMRSSRHFADMQELPTAQLRPSDSGFPGGIGYGPGGDDVGSIRSKKTKPEEGKDALELLVEQATARASLLLEKQKLSLPSSAATQLTLENLLARKPTVSKLTLRIDTAVFRGSFSNIPLWHALLDDLGLVTQLMQRNSGLFAPAPVSLHGASVPEAGAIRSAPAGSSQSDALMREKAAWTFRPGVMTVDIDVKSLAVVLCDDKPKSYGAPDILTAATERLALQYAMEKRFFDHMPEQSGSIALVLSAQFLNNSTGRWEHLMEPWPAELYLSDPINPIFKSSRTKYIYMTSSELLKLNFHPSCLLTVGDSLAFVRQLCTRSDAVPAEAPSSEKPPTSGEQMALGGSIMSRVPQRYLIQNMTGMLVSYWAPSPEQEGRAHANASASKDPQRAGHHAEQREGRSQPNVAANKKTLRPGCSEELRVAPTTKEVKIVGPGGVVTTRLSAQVIVLKFEGNWLPIPDVSVDVVGKYCYNLYSPYDNRRTPVVVDVVLVGRTKIIKVHSALYVQNSTNMKVGFRLHLPSAPLARQIVLAPGDVQLPGEQDIRLYPLKPGKGRYLPVVAALDGVLYLEPHKYLPAEHDVIRLFPAVTDMPGQSGFIASGPPEGPPARGIHGKTPLHFAVKVKVKSRTEYSYTTFHSMEVPGPGEFSKASRPLEASIKIMPSTILTNSLPYRMEGYLITLDGSQRAADMRATGTASAAERHALHAESDTGRVGEAKGSAHASAETTWWASRQRQGGDAPEEPEASLCAKVIAEMRELARMLKPDLPFPDVTSVPTDIAKGLLLALLRYELRWAVKRGIKEMDLLVRAELESCDKISWQELGAFVEWSKRNVRRVGIQPGEAQQMYVDMRKQAVLCVKVPDLKLVSSRPIELNHGARTASSHDVEELPEYMRLTRVEEPVTLDAIAEDILLRKERALGPTVLQGVREKAGALTDKFGTAVRAALRASQEPRAAEGVHARLDSTAFWQRNPDTLVRLELRVEPGPWLGATLARESSHHCSAATQSAAALPTLSPRVASPQSLATVSILMSGTTEGAGLDRASHGTSGEHIRLRLQYRPEGSPTQARRVAQGAFKLFHQHLPAKRKGMGAKKEGADDAGSVDSANQPDSKASQFQRSPDQDTDPASPCAVRARIHVAPAMDGSGQEEVRLLLIYVAGTTAQARHFQPTAPVLPSGSTAALLADNHVGSRPSLRQLWPLRRRRTAGLQPAPRPPVSRVSATSDYRSPFCGGPVARTVESSGTIASGLSRTASQPLDLLPYGSRPQRQAGRSGSSQQLNRLLSEPLPPFESNEESSGAAAPSVVNPAAAASLMGSCSKAMGGAVVLESQGVGIGRGDAEPSVAEPEPERSPAASFHAAGVRAQAGSSASEPTQQRSVAAASTEAASPHTPRVTGGQTLPPVGLVHSPQSSEATPQTVVILHSGATSPISLPSASPGLEASPYAVWSENPAFLRGSGMSSVSTAELPARRPPNDFYRNAGDIITSAGPRLDSTPERIPSRDAALRASGDGSHLNQGTAIAGAAQFAARAQPTISLVVPRAEAVEHEASFAWATADAESGRYARDSQSLDASVRSSHASVASYYDGGEARPEANAMQTAPAGRLSLLSPHSQPLRVAAAGRTVPRPSITALRRRSAVSHGGLAVRRLPRSASTGGGQAVAGANDGAAVGPADPQQRKQPTQKARSFGGSSGHGIAADADAVPSADTGYPGRIYMRRSGTASARQRSATGLPAIRESYAPGAPLGALVDQQLAPRTSPDAAPSGATSMHSSPLRRSPGMRGVSEGSGIPLAPPTSVGGRLGKAVSERFPGRVHLQRRAATARGMPHHSPVQLARTVIGSAKSVVPRLPSMARNMGERIKGGSQHVAGAVLQGGTGVVSMVGDALVQGGQQVAGTLLAGGQEVKGKVVAGTEAVIDAAKPKIKKTLAGIAWQVTEGLRRRKQGDRPEQEAYENQESVYPRGGKKKDASRTPKVLFLNLHNSLATKEEDHVCRLSLYAPFWVDNRTGLDLVFQDLDAPPLMDSLPFLLWQPVCAPGQGSDAKCLDSPGDPAAESMGGAGAGLNRAPRMASNGGSGFSPMRRGSHVAQTAKLALLNDQPRTRFRVDDEEYSKTDLSNAFTIATTSQKYAVEVKAEKLTVPVSELRHDVSNGCADASAASGLRPWEQSNAGGAGAHLVEETPHQPAMLQQLPALPLSPSEQAAALEGPSGSGLRIVSFDGQISTSPRPPAAPRMQARESEHNPAAPIVAAYVPTSEITPIEEEPTEEPSSNMGRIPLPPLPSLPEEQPNAHPPATRTDQDQLLSPVSSVADTVVQRSSTAGAGRFSEAARFSHTQAGTALAARVPYAQVDSGEASAQSTALCGPLPRPLRKEPETVSMRRLYQFAVEVWPAPSNTVFGRTKLITVKNKYLIRNATGLTIEYKQKGTPDPDGSAYGIGRRFAQRLENGWRAAWHWDNAYAEQELMIRPAGDEWEWSGSFKLPESEDYFGLRIRHRRRQEFVIIPVNITVGAAGSVLITLKSKESVPPYMVVNRCRDITIRLKQADWPGRNSTSAGRMLRTNTGWDDWDMIQPNGHEPMPFAWDEPQLRHVVQIVATTHQTKQPDKANAIDVSLDTLDVFTVIYVQNRSSKHDDGPLGPRTEGREKHTRGLLQDNAKRVYVTVYADGPTRVLCFSEDRTAAANMDDENSLLNLSYRLNQVSTRLKEVEQKLVLQLGGTQAQPRSTLDPAGGARDAAPAAPIPEIGTPDAEPKQAQDRAIAAAPAAVPAPQSDATGLLRHGSHSGWAQARAAIHLMRAQSRAVSVSSVPGSVTARWPSMRPQGPAPPAYGAVGSFGAGRMPSLGQRQGSGVPHGLNRQPSLPHSGGGAQQAQRPHHSRNQSGQSYAAGQASSGHAGLPPLLAATASDASLLPPIMGAAYGSDIEVPIGGDLTVWLRSAEGLTAGFSSHERLMAVEAKMRINSNDPTLKGRQDHLNATATWNQPTELSAAYGPDIPPALSGSGNWTSNASCINLEHREETFRDIPASAELQIDFYVTKGAEQPHMMRATGPHGAPTASGKGYLPTSSMSTVAVWDPHISRQFAGCVRVPLMLTLMCERNREWRFGLERKVGSQTVRGHLVLSFEWSVTYEGLLVREITALENILAQKLELLANLNPLPATATAAFVRTPGTGALAATRAAAAMAARPDASSAAGGLHAGSRSLGLGAAGADTVLSHAPSPARALSESYSVDLEVSVLEVSGLLPREGLRANIVAALHGRSSANTVSTAMLPRAFVTVSCAGETLSAAAGVNSVHPRFPKNSCKFNRVPLGAKVLLQVHDQVTSSMRRLLAEAELNVSDIPGTDPLYAWLALPRCMRRARSNRMLALVTTLEDDGTEVDLQMLVRIKIDKPQVHGVLAAVTLDLAGVGLCAKTNLEELFNFTVQKVRASLVQTRTELQVSAVVDALQLDNQLLEATNPVVLSKSDGSQSGSVAHARRRHKARLARRAGGSSPLLRIGNQETPLRDPLISFQMVYNQASSNHAGAKTEGQRDNFGILSFKKVVVELGPLDFSADQEFIEALVAYLNVLPLADVTQDAAWRAQIDAKQSQGVAADEDAAAAMAMAGRSDRNAESALAWLLAKEASELELLRGQSSMWFYLGEFYLSDIFVNVTLSLSSSFNAGAQLATPTAKERQRSMLRAFMSRMSGSNGFQLINVTNAPIQLEYVGFENRLVNRVSLVNTLWRHYSWIALAQARKVLGGAGPAIAAIPASVLWASLALVDLGQDVAAKRMSPLQIPTRIGYVTFTLTGQVIGVISRAMCAVMGLLPPRFSSDTANLSDSEAARRFAVKPQTFIDALYLGQKDVLLGVMAAAYGFVHDTAAGARWPNGLSVLGVPTGLVKASLGLALRPTAGMVEATSKMLQGTGLLCLGKRGIQGKLIRRVQAPGVAITDVVQAARASAVQEAYQAAMIAAWQNALPAIAAALADDEVVDVVAARASRVVLLTNRHLAYIYAKRHAPSSSASAAGGGAASVSYRVKWIIPNDHIDNIRGLERGYAINVEYHKPVKLGRMSLKLPLRKGMRTSTAESHKNLIFRLNRHIGHSGGNPTRNAGSLAAAANNVAAAAAQVEVQDLRIMG